MNTLKTWPACIVLAIAQLPQLACAQSSTATARANAPAGAMTSLSPEIEKLGAAASAGDAESQYRLAQKYSRGDGVPRSSETAVLWLGKAAAQGHVAAQATLGTNYLVGEGARKDVTMAIQWLTKAAEQGHPMAQTNLGALYLNGDGAPQNFRQALFWLEKAAAQGMPLAQYSLGKMYQYGYGVRTDEAAALQWYTKATQQNYAPAREALAEIGKGAPADKNAASSARPAGKPPAASAAVAAAAVAPAPATTAAAPSPASSPQQQDRDAVAATLQAWAAAWSARKPDDYLGYYADSFAPAGGDSRAAWAAQRRSRIEGRQRIAVTLSAPEIEVRGASASAVFRQHYESDNLAETSRKKLILVRQGEGWKIQQEISEKLSRKDAKR